MKKLIAFALGLFMAVSLCSFSGPAFASFAATLDPLNCTVAPCYKYDTDYYWDGVYRFSKAAACDAALNVRKGYFLGIGYTGPYSVLTVNYCAFWFVPPGGGAAVQPSAATVRTFADVAHPPAYVCPSNSVLGGSQCTCSAGFDESGSACVAHVNVCAAKVGIVGVTNFTVGYVRTTAEDDDAMVGGANQVPSNMQMCDAGCTVQMSTGLAAWRSMTPTAQGLYRMSIDFASVPTGAECTMGTADAPANPATVAPTCPGFVGDINGVKGCYGTASAPVTTTTASRSTAPLSLGNPSAGAKPLTGEGSGVGGSSRVPSSGTGGNAGGPAASSINPKGNGTTATPAAGTEQLNCGAPGQAKCGIDETGTPSGTGTFFDAANTSLTTNKDASGTAISGAQSIAAPSWSFTFALPTGCAAFVTAMPGVTINPCAYQSTIHDLMSMIWAAVTAFCIIGMVGRTIREA